MEAVAADEGGRLLHEAPPRLGRLGHRRVLDRALVPAADGQRHLQRRVLPPEALPVATIQSSPLGIESSQKKLKHF